MERKKLNKKIPSKLFRNNFIVRLPDLVEQEDEELKLSVEKDNSELIVVAKSDDCSLNIGDSVIMNNNAAPIVILPLEDGDYAIFSEHNVIGIW